MQINKPDLIRAVIFASIPIVLIGSAYFMSPARDAGHEIRAEAAKKNRQPSIVSSTTHISIKAEDSSGVDSLPDTVVVEGTSYTRVEQNEVEYLRTWSTDHGYHGEEDLEVYRGYSDGVLNELGKKGDLIALHLLADKAVKKGDSSAAMAYMHQAVIYGSTTELDMLTIYTRPQPTNDSTEEMRRPAALETMAVTKVIALRGDKYLANASESTFVKSYKQLYDVDLKLSPQEQKFVENRAQQIYDKYQSIRHAKGLGDFDNSEPSALTKILGLK